MKFCLACCALILIVTSSGAFEEQNSRILVKTSAFELSVQALTPCIFHILAVPAGHDSVRPGLSVVAKSEEIQGRLKQSADWFSLQTTDASVLIDRRAGSLEFRDNLGKMVLRSEALGGSAFEPITLADGGAFKLTAGFRFPEHQALYGLGQFEDGLLDLRNRDLLLVQANRVAINPFLVSTSGCGLLWDNYSATRFTDRGGISTFRSDAGDAIDYYVVIGGSIDAAIAGYRHLTGAAPLFPLWAYGYFQSKERYQSADELIAVVKEYRDRRIPLDVIVQDWAYWGDQDHFSGMSWDPVRYPNPSSMVDALHQLNARLMVSIWPAFGPASAIYRQMEEGGFLFSEPHWCGGRVYDAYAPAARDLYWKHVKSSLLDNGVDAYWLDGTEPEFRCTDDRYVTAASICSCRVNALGSTERYLNPYSLMTTRGVYEGHRSSGSGKRVFILTRSAFSGQQRYAAATWSGDTFAGWESFKNQIAAGLSFCLSGIPYWTADIGGFLSQPLYPAGCKDPAYRELYVRWFQFGAFCPIFRAHGTHTPREIWRFGEPGSWSYEALVQADRLRYRLLPYIYSLAWRVTTEGYTMMRGLAMDFPADEDARSVLDQFMFGPSLLVCPVTQPMLTVVSEQGEAIPSRLLYSANGVESGWDVEFFSDIHFTNSRLRRKLDQSQLGWSGCLPQDLDGPYSAICEGLICTEEAGEYRLNLRTNGGVRLWLEDSLLIDAPENHEERLFASTLVFEENKKYPLRIEHRQFSPHQASLRLTWLKPRLMDRPERMRLYFPPERRWFDFWSGEKVVGDYWQQIVPPSDHLPLYVPEGAILPLGPDIQFSGQRTSEPMEIRIYPGRDASFTLYDDEKDGYNYEQGAYATIPFVWQDHDRELIIGDQRGHYPGMPASQDFRIVLAGCGRGTGLAAGASGEYLITYSGREVRIKF